MPHAGLVIFLLFAACNADRKFPDGFMWGTATAAYQIEGAWNAAGKGENIWDKFTHEGGHTYNNDTGDVACKSYYKYKEDIALMKDMGVTHYRFSISWSRVLPSGKRDSYNAQGMQFYKDLVNELTANGIIPMATLYHWDLPQPLEDVGGWQNDSMIGYFEDYAQKCFDELGSKVKYWLTFNEPFVACWLGYGIGIHAPGHNQHPGTYPYICAHNVIRSHARAWHLYNSTYRATQKGKISITLDSDWKEPASARDEDVQAAERAMQFKLGWFANPIYGTGDYPEIMKTRVSAKSKAGGLNKSRLPAFTDREKVLNKGTHDFFGLNHYTTQLISNKVQPVDSKGAYDKDQDIQESHDPSWKQEGSSWLYRVPWGLRKLLNWIKKEYGNPNVVITENGVSDKTGTLEDDDRIAFYDQYIDNVHKAIGDGCDVFGYTAWSLLDNFEWASGYSEKFGLHRVDFKDPNRARTPKKSAKWFRRLISKNGWDDSNGAYNNRINGFVLLMAAVLFFHRVIQ